MTLYLASTSPRRHQLMKLLRLPFLTLRPRTTEQSGSAGRPRRDAVSNARAKALSVAPAARRGLVIGVDTVVALGRLVLGKPASAADARRMLELLSGRTHAVVTGLAVVHLPGRRVCACAETTQVTFRRLSRREVESYVRSAEPYDKAGGYAIQGAAARFVKRLSGSYSNVVGLPVYRLLALLREAGLPPGPDLRA